MKTTTDTPKGTKLGRKYKITNWSEYNKALIARGSLTLWLPGDLEECWYGQGKYAYSDQAIEIMLVLKARFRLPLRCVVGFARSTLTTVEIPDYTTLSRRAGRLEIALKKRIKETVSMNLDSSGLKVHGEGEWKVRIHGKSRRRTWTKLHVAVDDDGEIRAVVTTHCDVHDGEPIDDILIQEHAIIGTFRGDGAYDGAPVYMSLRAREVSHVCIPPRKDAKIRIHGNSHAPPYTRDENIRAIRDTSRKRWKVESGYHRRSVSENTFFRFKTILGDRLSFRIPENQRTEILIKCNILNRFHEMGMPDCHLVAVP